MKYDVHREDCGRTTEDYARESYFNKYLYLFILEMRLKALSLALQVTLNKNEFTKLSSHIRNEHHKYVTRCL